MNITTPPKVATVIPKNYAADVATDLTVITVGFSTDIDPATFAGNIRLQSKDGVPIPLTHTYEHRILRLTIKQPLTPNMSYQLMLFGDGNLDDSNKTGICSVLGVPLAGTAVSNFTTVKSDKIASPVASYPSDKSIVNTIPAFNWNEVEGAVHYEIEVSRHNSMTPIHWASQQAKAPIYPSIPLSDGVHYWRVRAVDKDGKVSDWSAMHLFNLDTVQEAPIVEEDTLEPQMDYDHLEDESYVELLGTFPKEAATNVSTKLQTIYFTVLGDVSVEDVSIELFGESVLGEDADHEDVDGTLEVIKQEDGTTLIAFTPVVLQNT